VNLNHRLGLPQLCLRNRFSHTENPSNIRSTADADDNPDVVRHGGGGPQGVARGSRAPAEMAQERRAGAGSHLQGSADDDRYRLLWHGLARCQNCPGQIISGISPNVAVASVLDVPELPLLTKREGIGRGT
jgi:hypothetical protein